MKVAAIILLLAFASVASARNIPFRSLLSDEEEPIYCEDEHDDQCPEHYECKKLDRPVCDDVSDCKEDKEDKHDKHDEDDEDDKDDKHDKHDKHDEHDEDDEDDEDDKHDKHDKHDEDDEDDKDDKDECDHDKKCWKYKCVKKPRYCEPSYKEEDECVEKYGDYWKCKELKKPVCVYEKDCTTEETDKCEEYDKVCKHVDGDCKEYKKEHVCKEKKVCKKYKQEKQCEKKYGYDDDTDCEYVDTDECLLYKTDKYDCKKVDTNECKEYEKVKKCEKGDCIKYVEEEVCKDVKVCWEGICEEFKKGKYPRD